MIGNIIKSVKKSFLKKSIMYFLNETSILSSEKERLTNQILEFYSREDVSNLNVIYAYPFVYLREKEIVVEKIQVYSGNQTSAFYYTPKKIMYINKEEYVKKGSILQIGSSSKKAAASTDDSGGFFGGTGSNNNNNNNNNG